MCSELVSDAGAGAASAALCCCSYCFMKSLISRYPLPPSPSRSDLHSGGGSGLRASRDIEERVCIPQEDAGGDTARADKATCEGALSLGLSAVVQLHSSTRRKCKPQEVFEDLPRRTSSNRQKKPSQGAPFRSDKKRTAEANKRKMEYGFYVRRVGEQEEL